MTYIQSPSPILIQTVPSQTALQPYVPFDDTPYTFQSIPGGDNPGGAGETTVQTFTNFLGLFDEGDTSRPVFYPTAYNPYADVLPQTARATSTSPTPSNNNNNTNNDATSPKKTHTKPPLITLTSSQQQGPWILNPTSGKWEHTNHGLIEDIEHSYVIEQERVQRAFEELLEAPLPEDTRPPPRPAPGRTELQLELGEVVDGFGFGFGGEMRMRSPGASSGSGRESFRSLSTTSRSEEQAQEANGKASSSRFRFANASNDRDVDIDNDISISPSSHDHIRAHHASPASRNKKRRLSKSSFHPGIHFGVGPLGPTSSSSPLSSARRGAPAQATPAVDRPIHKNNGANHEAPRRIQRSRSRRRNGNGIPPSHSQSSLSLSPTPGVTPLRDRDPSFDLPPHSMATPTPHYAQHQHQHQHRQNSNTYPYPHEDTFLDGPLTSSPGMMMYEWDDRYRSPLEHEGVPVFGGPTGAPNNSRNPAAAATVGGFVGFFGRDSNTAPGGAPRRGVLSDIGMNSLDSPQRGLSNTESDLESDREGDLMDMDEDPLSDSGPGEDEGEESLGNETLLRRTPPSYSRVLSWQAQAQTGIGPLVGLPVFDPYLDPYGGGVGVGLASSPTQQAQAPPEMPNEAHLLERDRALIKDASRGVAVLETHLLTLPHTPHIDALLLECTSLISQDGPLKSCLEALERKESIPDDVWGCRTGRWCRVYVGRLGGLQMTLHRLIDLTNRIPFHEEHHLFVLYKLRALREKLVDVERKLAMSFSRLRIYHLHTLLRQNHRQDGARRYAHRQSVAAVRSRIHQQQQALNVNDIENIPPPPPPQSSQRNPPPPPPPPGLLYPKGVRKEQRRERRVLERDIRVLVAWNWPVQGGMGTGSL